MPATADNRVLEGETQRLCPSQTLETLAEHMTNSHICWFLMFVFFGALYPQRGFALTPQIKASNIGTFVNKGWYGSIYESVVSDINKDLIFSDISKKHAHNFNVTD